MPESYGPAMPARPIIVLTGFGPFPGIPYNATQTLIPRLANDTRALFPAYDVVAEILPTEWGVAPARLKVLFDAGNVALVLHFGVAQDTKGFRLELVGRNLQTSLEDAAGNLPESSRVIEGGPDLLASTLPAERIAARLMGLGLPCATSDNAGTFLCNALLYHSLAVSRAAPSPRLAGFVHIPASLVGHGRDNREPHPDCPLDWKTAVLGGLEIIAACLEHIDEQST
jgi:pyroglutamyl-peptidase